MKTWKETFREEASGASLCAIYKDLRNGEKLDAYWMNIWMTSLSLMKKHFRRYGLTKIEASEKTLDLLRSENRHMIEYIIRKETEQWGRR